MRTEVRTEVTTRVSISLERIAVYLCSLDIQYSGRRIFYKRGVIDGVRVS